jgi:hypothetical protein
MLLVPHIHPTKDIYYLGAKLIKILGNLKNGKKVDFFEAFNKMKAYNITINLFILTIDWLFVLGIVNNVADGFIEICL